MCNRANHSRFSAASVEMFKEVVSVALNLAYLHLEFQVQIQFCVGRKEKRQRNPLQTTHSKFLFFVSPSSF